MMSSGDAYYILRCYGYSGDIHRGAAHRASLPVTQRLLRVVLVNNALIQDDKELVHICDRAALHRDSLGSGDGLWPNNGHLRIWIDARSSQKGRRSHLHRRRMTWLGGSRCRDRHGYPGNVFFEALSRGDRPTSDPLALTQGLDGQYRRSPSSGLGTRGYAENRPRGLRYSSRIRGSCRENMDDQIRVVMSTHLGAPWGGPRHAYRDLFGLRFAELVQLYYVDNHPRPFNASQSGRVSQSNLFFTLTYYGQFVKLLLQVRPHVVHIATAFGLSSSRMASLWFWPEHWERG